MARNCTAARMTLCLSLTLWLPGLPAGAQPFFVDATADMRHACPGIFSSRGISLADYNNDGRPDLFFASNGDPKTLVLENTGLSAFLDVTGTALPALSHHRRGGGPVWGDYDNDGDLDLFVPVGAWDPAQRDANPDFHGAPWS
jgi:hypothetical protein